MPFTDSILAGNTLVRDSIQSEGYVAGSTGWSINRDGTAEFNSVTSRGDWLVGDPAAKYIKSVTTPQPAIQLGTANNAEETLPASISELASAFSSYLFLNSPERNSSGNQASISLIADDTPRTQIALNADEIYLQNNIFSVTTKYKTADTTVNNTTTLATDPDLAISGISAGKYSVELLLLYSSSAVANWKGFLTATGSISDRLIVVQRNPIGGGAYGDAIAEGAVTFTAIGAGVGTKRAIKITGSINVTGTGQAYNLQWAQNTLDPTNTVLHKGSYYRLQRIA